MSAQRVELQRYLDLGRSIASSLEETDPGLSGVLLQQMTSVTRGFKDLEDSLKDVKSRLSRARLSSSELADLVNATTNQIEDLRDRVENLPPAEGLNADWIAQQLENCQVLSQSFCSVNQPLHE